MTVTARQTPAFLRHLRDEAAGFVLRRAAGAPEWADEALHAGVYDSDPELYALCGLAEQARPVQQARILFQLLRQSRTGLADDARRTLDRITACLLAALSAERVLTGFLALRRVRANHKHASRAVLRYLFNHPRLEELAGARRPAVVDCLEHALGKNVARACARLMAENGLDDHYLRRHLLRFADNPRRAAEVLAFLYGRGPRPAVPAEQAAPVPVSRVEEPQRPKTVTATNRGAIAATLVHIYQGGTNAELEKALTDCYVCEAAANLPRFDGRVALVLDASASTLGYGERQFCCIAQSQALRLVLEHCCAVLKVVLVGGCGEPPRPEGDTDLAGALLDALDGDPDLVTVVSDGYENVHDGDLARVAASLPAAGVTTPVVFCHSQFSGKDDLVLRRPAPALPELGFWHQDDFVDVLWALFAHARPPHGDGFVRRALRQRLEALEATQV